MMCKGSIECVLVIMRYVASICRNVRRSAVPSIRPETPVPSIVSLERDDVMMDSLIQGLLHEQQTGNYFETFLRKTGKQVGDCSIFHNWHSGCFLKARLHGAYVCRM